MIRRTILSLLLALATAALVAPLAVADPPIKVPLPPGDATGSFCEGFDVRVADVQNRSFLHIFSSGAALITGVLKVEVTNLSTGKTLWLNISGPGKISADGSTVTGTGRWLLFGEAGELGPGSGPGMTLVSGQLHLQLDASGAIATYSTNGRVEDVCAALAG